MWGDREWRWGGEKERWQDGGRNKDRRRREAKTRCGALVSSLNLQKTNSLPETHEKKRRAANTLELIPPKNRAEVFFKQGEEGTESLSRGFEGIGIHREILEKLVLKEGESAMRMVDHQGGRPRAVSCRGDLLLLSFLRTWLTQTRLLTTRWSYKKGVRPSGWCLLKVVFHQGGLLSGLRRTWLTQPRIPNHSHIYVQYKEPGQGNHATRAVTTQAYSS